jgi:hypothetical protein
LKEFLGCTNCDAEAIGAREVLFIVGNYDAAPSSDRRLQHHFIFGVSQGGPPEEVDLLAPGHTAKILQDIHPDLPIPRGRIEMTKEHRLVFQKKRNRDANLETPSPNQREKLGRCPALGSQGRDEHIRVEDYPRDRHSSIVGDTRRTSQG